MFANFLKRKELLVYVIWKLESVNYDRLCELIFVAANRRLIDYNFDGESGNILASTELRKDISDLVRKALVIEQIEKIDEDFDENTHVYKVTKYGESIARKIENSPEYMIVELKEFLSTFAHVGPEEIEKKIMEIIRG